MSDLTDALARNATSVVQFSASPSKARRAASMAASMSAAVPSAATPSTSSVAGLTVSKVSPLSASTEWPLMNSW